ncbi:MAG: tryptophan synthase subunit alpha [Pseudomonadota bacterium]
MTPAPRLAARFARARAEKRAALIVYLTADDPDGPTSLRLMKAVADAGADVIEVGVPWSDPSADGKAIQAAMHRALAKGGGLRRSLALCTELRAASPDVGLVLFGYANPILVTGTDAFAAKARAAGVDGVLCVDYPPDADPALRTALAHEGLDYVPLLAPTSTDARIDAALGAAGSFVYYVSMTGITGTALADLTGPREKVAAIRARGGGRVPVAVGFGIRTPQAAHAVAEFADAVVVGSAAVEIVARAAETGRDPIPEMTAFVRSLRDAITNVK